MTAHSPQCAACRSPAHVPASMVGRVAARPAGCRGPSHPETWCFPGRGRCASIFLDKNGRHIGKSQSKRPTKRTQRPPHLGFWLKHIHVEPSAATERHPRSEEPPSVYKLGDQPILIASNPVKSVSLHPHPDGPALTGCRWAGSTRPLGRRAGHPPPPPPPRKQGACAPPTPRSRPSGLPASITTAGDD
jgi:hypothetical protein